MVHREVPFFRPSIGEREIAAVAACLRSGWLTTGPAAKAFEASFSEAVGAGVTSLAVTSATAAMHLGLEGLGVGAGDEVILPTLTFTATAEVIRYLGATPIFVDVDPDTLCIGPAQVEPAITSRTRVIMPVHFGGRCCDMTGLRALADKAGLKILDDAAHAFPASHAGQSIGRCGADATAFSFYANKTITTGEGGMLVTRDPDLAARARTMRLHGIDRDVFNRFTDRAGPWFYDVVAPGYKYNMTDVAAAMGCVQLDRRTEFHLKRTQIAQRYDNALRDLPSFSRRMRRRATFIPGTSTCCSFGTTPIFHAISSFRPFATGGFRAPFTIVPCTRCHSGRRSLRNRSSRTPTTIIAGASRYRCSWQCRKTNSLTS